MTSTCYVKTRHIRDFSIIAHIEELREPFVRLEVITGTDTIGGIMKLAESRRCKLVKTDYLSPTRVMLEYKAPLAEIVYDFYDLLKGISRAMQRWITNSPASRPATLSRSIFS